MNHEGVHFCVWEKPNFSESEVAERSPCSRYVRYKKTLGRGAFKDVYKGFDQIQNMEIAWSQICIDDETTLNSPENQETLISEAVLLKSMNHGNIMKCHDFWLDYENKTVNMISELFSSGSLRQYTKKIGSVDVQTIKNWGIQILQGLNHLHTQNPCIIHRDLKCDNIFLDVANGEIKIGDFGLAATMERDPLRALAGTPEFMAPEYYDEEYNELVDIYAFGMCLIEMSTLEHPYSECTNPAQIFKKVTSGVKPAALAKVEDPEVKAIIEKCLLPASSRPSAMELLKDPFFRISGETEYCRSDSCVTVADMDGMLDNSGLSLEVGLRGDAVDRRVVDSCSREDGIVSGISALYNCMSLSDGMMSGRCCYQSSCGDVSMNSRITFASSSGAVSRDLFLSVSKPILLGLSQANVRM